MFILHQFYSFYTLLVNYYFDKWEIPLWGCFVRYANVVEEIWLLHCNDLPWLLFWFVRRFCSLYSVVWLFTSHLTLVLSSLCVMVVIVSVCGSYFLIGINSTSNVWMFCTHHMFIREIMFMCVIMAIWVACLILSFLMCFLQQLMYSCRLHVFFGGLWFMASQYTLKPFYSDLKLFIIIYGLYNGVHDLVAVFAYYFVALIVYFVCLNILAFIHGHIYWVIRCSEILTFVNG